jgi:hypothetical protein
VVMGASTLTYFVMLVALSCWQLTGLWRSAQHHIHRTHRWFWARLAQGTVVISVAVLLVSSMTVLLPTAYTCLLIALGLDPIPPAEVRELANGREIALGGPIGFGTTERIRGRLALYPHAAVLRLTSPGGRVTEGRKLRDLVASRGMVTYADGECMSACTLVFVAGRQRVLNDESGVIGFHQYGLPGVPSSAWVDGYADDETFAINAGVEREFATRMFTLSNTDMWKPAHEELVASKFVTKLSDGSEFAIDTDDPDKWVEELDSTLRKERVYRAIALYDPSDFADTEATILRIVNSGGALEPIPQVRATRRWPRRSARGRGSSAASSPTG